MKSRKIVTCVHWSVIKGGLPKDGLVEITLDQKQLTSLAATAAQRIFEPK